MENQFLKLKKRSGLVNRELSQLTGLTVDAIKEIAIGRASMSKKTERVIKLYINYIEA